MPVDVVEAASSPSDRVVADAAAMPTERLEAEIKTLAGHIAAAMCRWLLLVAEFDRREGWLAWECRSCVHWLGWQCSMAPRTAQEHLRVAHALGELPLVRAKFATGELSYSQVRAITRVADCPVVEEYFVNIALNATAACLERLISGFRGTNKANDADAADRWSRREFSWWMDDDGMFCFTGRLAPDDAQIVIAAIGAATVPATRRSAERPVDDQGEPLPQPGDDPKKARQADALVAICNTALTGQPLPARTAPAGTATDPAAAATTPGPDDAASDHDTTPDRDLASERPTPGDESDTGQPVQRSGLVVDPTSTVVVLVGGDTLGLDADGPCRLDGGPNLSPETARRLACDATTYTIAVDADGHTRLVDKAAKTVSRRLRRELGIRDDGRCQFPGCDLIGTLEAHHIIHREHDGPNTLENLITLCRFHHHVVHEGGYRIELLLGQVIVHRPHRDPLSHTAPTPVTGADLETRNRLAELTIDADTIMSDWDGTRLRHDDASWSIAFLNDERDRQLANATSN